MDPASPTPEKRALQIWRWMYAETAHGHHHPTTTSTTTPTTPSTTRRTTSLAPPRYISDLAETIGFQNGLSDSFCRLANGERLPTATSAATEVEGVVEKGTPRVGLTLTETHTAQDGTVKLIFTAEREQHHDVHAASLWSGRVETVLIPVVRDKGRKARYTVCVSSQIGCAMNCQFCFTGKMGLQGNLSTAQIVEQVVEAKRYLVDQRERTAAVAAAAAEREKRELNWGTEDVEGQGGPGGQGGEEREEREGGEGGEGGERGIGYLPPVVPYSAPRHATPPRPSFPSLSSLAPTPLRSPTITALSMYWIDPI